MGWKKKNIYLTPTRGQKNKLKNRIFKGKINKKEKKSRKKRKKMENKEDLLGEVQVQAQF